MKLKTSLFLFLLSSCSIIFSNFIFAQNYSRTDTIPVKVNGNWLKMPWVGGHNFCQLSELDINMDGIKDLFLFDRTGIKITCYINKGTPNTVDYLDSTLKYKSGFPHLEEWALARDYNCDGKADIFTYGYGGISVWRNVSTGNTLQFILQTSGIKSNYCPAILNLAVTGVDIPTIDDIDGDGDLDILTYDAGGINMQYHVNKSKELGYGCDSLIFNLDCTACWGNFRASVNGCNMVFGSCRIMNPDSSGSKSKKEERHAGNCSMCLDTDGDGDKEILLGQLGCCNMVLLTNGGSSASANMTAMDDSFPSYNIPAILTSFPCGYFLDLNNDGKRDLIVSPNAPNVSINQESIWYYLNTGTDNVPVFNRQTKALFQQDMIDAGEGATPVFFDFTNDGLTDLLISNYIAVIDSCPSSNAYGVLAYKNIGTLSSPKFELVNSNYANLSAQLTNTTSMHLCFGDMDGDSDADMCVGDFNGYIHYFQNTSNIGNPANYNHIGLLSDVISGNVIDVGNYSTPQLVDIDRDGDLDLIIGERAGNLNYYKNTGTILSYSFSFITSSFGGVDVLKSNVTGYSTPFIYDNAGTYQLLVGSEASRTYANTMGWIWKFKNIDANLAGNFTLVDSMYKNIWEGLRMSVHGNDINNDGSLDLVIGNYAGGVAIYLGDSSTVSVSEHDMPNIDFSIYPNPSKGEINVSITSIIQNEIEFNIYNMLGKRVYTHIGNTKHTNTIDASALAGGIYSFEIRSHNLSGTKKLVLIK